jgi:uncharacterized protein YaeQ
MAQKATVHKAALQIADMDRGLYADHALTLARQPSETEERLMMRLLAFALNVPADDRDGTLVPALGVADADEPDFWHRSLGGEVLHWVEVGQPEERRIVRACGRAARVTVLAYAASTTLWWAPLRERALRLRGLTVWQVPAEESRALAALAGRSMQLQVTVQDGAVWLGDATRSVELHPQRLTAG